MATQQLPISLGPQDARYEFKSSVHQGFNLYLFSTVVLSLFAGFVFSCFVVGYTIGRSGLVRNVALAVYGVAWLTVSVLANRKKLLIVLARRKCSAATKGQEIQLSSERMVVSSLLVFDGKPKLINWSLGELGYGPWFLLDWKSIKHWHSYETSVEYEGSITRYYFYMIELTSGRRIRVAGFPAAVESEALRRLRESGSGAIIERSSGSANPYYAFGSK